MQSRKQAPLSRPLRLLMALVCLTMLLSLSTPLQAQANPPTPQPLASPQTDAIPTLTGGLETAASEATPAPVEVVIVEASTGEPVATEDVTPRWVEVVIVVLGSVVLGMSTLLSAGSYAALRQSLKTGAQIAEVFAKATPTTIDDEFIKRFKAALKLDAPVAPSAYTAKETAEANLHAAIKGLANAQTDAVSAKTTAINPTDTPSAFDPYAPTK